MAAAYKEHLIASVTFPTSDHDVITARLVTHNMNSSVDPVRELISNKPITLRAGGDTLPIINLERWSRTSSSSNIENLGKDNTSRLLWSREYVTDQFADLRIAGLALAKDVTGTDIIVLSGTTAGHGDAFGGINKGHGDADGFVTKLNANNGNLISDGNGQVSSARIHTLAGFTDELRGMCIDHDRNALYVVGSTTMFGIANKDGGYLYTAFIKKLNLATLETVWSRQVDEVAQRRDVFGRGCAVQYHDSDHWGSVYFTGIVKDGGQVNKNHLSFGYDDIFVSYHEDENGNNLYLTQFGTPYDDNIVTTEQSWFSSTDRPDGGVVVSSNTNDGQPKSDLFAGIDLVYQITPDGMVEILFGTLPKESLKLLERQSMNGSFQTSRLDKSSGSKTKSIFATTGDSGDPGLTIETSGVAIGLLIGLVVVVTVGVMLFAELMGTVCRKKKVKRRKRVNEKAIIDVGKEDETMIQDENPMILEEDPMISDENALV